MHLWVEKSKAAICHTVQCSVTSAMHCATMVRPAVILQFSEARMSPWSWKTWKYQDISELLFTGLEKSDDFICILQAHGIFYSKYTMFSHTQFNNISWKFIGQTYGNIKSS